MNKYIEDIKETLQAVKWFFISIIVGLVCGSVGIVFHICLDYASEMFSSVSEFIYFLPFAGVLIVFLYKGASLSISTGTDTVFEAVRSHRGVPWQLPPLIFVGTFLTHICGGSSGREGAALQLGGGIGNWLGRVMHMRKAQMHTIELCGMGAVFAALFGTPVGAAFFVIEVIDVGLIHYRALFPCLISCFAAALAADLLGVSPTRLFLSDKLMTLSVLSIGQILVLAGLCGLVAILFCKLMANIAKLEKRLVKNDYLRAFLFGTLIVVLTLILGTKDYNGAGMQIIRRALRGRAEPEAWILKMLFTAITLSAGFKGGEIVPAFFIGSTFGCSVAGILGIDPSLGAAIGMTALFCGVTNAPVASLLLALEIFSGKYMMFFALACGISYFISGKCSLYHSQSILESKKIWKK